MENFVALKDTLLSVLSMGVALWVVSELHSMRKSIESLNERMAAFIEKSSHLERRLDKLEDVAFKVARVKG